MDRKYNFLIHDHVLLRFLAGNARAAVYLVLFVRKGGVGSEIRGPALICLCDTKGHHLFRMGSGCQSPLPLCSLVPTEEPRHYGSPRLILIAKQLDGPAFYQCSS